VALLVEGGSSTNAEGRLASDGDFGALVAFAYSLVLQRDPGPVDVARHAEALGGGQSLRALLAEVAEADAARAVQIADLLALQESDDAAMLVHLAYRHVAAREPSAHEAATWRAALQDGCGVGALLDQIAASEDATRIFPPAGSDRDAPAAGSWLTDEVFELIAELALDYFRRLRSTASSDAVELRPLDSERWRRCAALRPKLASPLAVSSEEAARLVNFVYTLFVSREPDAVGRQVYVAGLRNGLAPYVFIKEIATTGECRRLVRSAR